MTDEELLQVPHHRNIPADLVALLLQRIRRFARAEAMMNMPAYDWYLRVSGRASKFRAVVPPEFRRGDEL